MISYKHETEVNTIATKTIAFRVEEEFHTQVKIQATKEGKSLQEYIIKILKKDIERKTKK